MAPIFSRVSILDPWRKWLCEVDWFTIRAWRNGAPGEGTMIVPSGDSKATEPNLRIGNIVFIESAAGDWVGVIDDEKMTQYYADHIEVPLVSGEKALDYRIGLPGPNIKDSTAGGLYRQLIQAGNQIADMGIREGEIEELGETKPLKIGNRSLLAMVQALAHYSGEEWAIMPDVIDGQFYGMKANWWARRGVFIDYALEEGQNLESEAGTPVMGTVGPVRNQQLVVARALVDSDNTASSATEMNSVSTYGLRQAITLNDPRPGVDQASVAQSFLAQDAYPKRQFHLSALNVGRTFACCEIGNILPIRIKSTPFGMIDTYVRIEGKSFDDRSGKMPLIFREVAL